MDWDSTYLQREFGEDFASEEMEKELDQNAENRKQWEEAVAVLSANIGRDIDAKKGELSTRVSQASGNISQRMNELETSLTHYQQGEESYLASLKRLKSVIEEKEQRSIAPVPPGSAGATATFPLEIVWGQIIRGKCVTLTIVNFKKYQYSNVQLQLRTESALVATKPCGTLTPGAQTVEVEALEVGDSEQLTAQLLWSNKYLSLPFQLKLKRAPLRTFKTGMFSFADY